MNWILLFRILLILFLSDNSLAHSKSKAYKYLTNPPVRRTCLKVLDFAICFVSLAVLKTRCHLIECLGFRAADFTGLGFTGSHHESKQHNIWHKYVYFLIYRSEQLNHLDRLSEAPKKTPGYTVWTFCFHWSWVVLPIILRFLHTWSRRLKMMRVLMAVLSCSWWVKHTSVSSTGEEEACESTKGRRVEYLAVCLKPRSSMLRVHIVSTHLSWSKGSKPKSESASMEWSTMCTPNIQQTECTIAACSGPQSYQNTFRDKKFCRVMADISSEIAD